MSLSLINDDRNSYSSDYESLPDVSVVEVYDLAFEIGNEFEKIIATHGNNVVGVLMPKVIKSLELLEKLVHRCDVDRPVVEELRNSIALLEQDKKESEVRRLRHEREYEQMEENWRREFQDLLSHVAKVEEENRRLSNALKEYDAKLHEQSVVVAENNVELLQKLRETNEKQRELLAAKEKELQDKSSEAESLQSQLDRLNESNQELRKKHRYLSQQMRTLVEERADLQAAVQQQTKEISTLQKSLGTAQKDNLDLIQSQPEIPDLKNKVLIDVNDPNRPRFTVAELKEILFERNELKARVSDLEDELGLYRPKLKANTSIAHSVLEHEIESSGEELPVQGPLPQDPDDAPWRKSKKESGIRKLFKRLLPIPGVAA